MEHYKLYMPHAGLYLFRLCTQPCVTYTGKWNILQTIDEIHPYADPFQLIHRKIE